MNSRAGAFTRGPYAATCVAAVAFLAFIAGSIATINEARSARVLTDAYRAGAALYGKMTQDDGPLPYDLWRPARTAGRGVTVHEPGKAQDGLTFYTSGHDQNAYLIDMEGRVLCEWGVPFSRAWDETALVRKP